MTTIPPNLVLRFQQDVERLERLTPLRQSSISLAVSGGPDSFALLLLARAAFPSRVRAATVDHGLRPESAAEAKLVAEACRELRVPHAILAPEWAAPPAMNMQAEARRARYAALFGWSHDIFTAHHQDDQAETLLMRLARGAGLSGLTGVRPCTAMTGPPSGTIIRPLLAWRKAELEEIVASGGLAAVRDPSNDDDAYDRTRARRLLGETDWLNPTRIALSASALGECDDALEWTTERLFRERARQEEGVLILDPRDLPRELQRRLLLRAMNAFVDAQALPGPKVQRLLDALDRGEPATLAGVLVRPKDLWHFCFAPARRSPGR